MEEMTTIEKLMDEVIENLAVLTEHTMGRVTQPPSGTMAETGHYRALNARLRRKELDALQQLLDEVAYNVAATLFATLDGEIETAYEDFPTLTVVERSTGEPIADSLHAEFERMFADDSELLPHPD